MSIRPDAVPTGERPVLWTRDFILVCLFVVFIFISFQMLMPTIPVFVQQMGGTPLMVGLVNGVFTISALALRPWIGLALDRHGRKLIWMIGTFVFVLATFGYIWALTIPLLFLMRIIHGAGWGVVTTASATAVADIVPMSRRGEGMGYFGLGATLGMVIGPAVGFYVINQLGFNWLFMVCAGLAIGALLIGTTVRLPVVHLNAKGSKAALYEPSSLMPSVTMFFITVAYGGIVTFIALHAYEYGILNVGFFFTVYALTVMAIRPICGLLYDRRGHRVVIIPGMILLALGTLVLAQATDITLMVIAAVICGLGIGATHPTLQAMAVAKCAPNRRGAASATFSSSFDLGIGVGAVLLGLTVQFIGYNGMYTVAAGIVVVGLLVYLITSAPPKKRLSAVNGTSA